MNLGDWYKEVHYTILYFCNMFEIFNNKKLDISMHYKSTCILYKNTFKVCIFFLLKIYSLIGVKATFQCCVGFRLYKANHNYTYITCLLSLPPSPHFTPLGLHRVPGSALCYIATSSPH